MIGESKGRIRYKTDGERAEAAFRDADRCMYPLRVVGGCLGIIGRSPYLDRSVAREVGELLIRFADTGEIRPPDADPAPKPEPLPPGWRRDGDGTAYREDGTEVAKFVASDRWYITLPGRCVPRPRYFATEIEAIRRADELQDATRPKDVGPTAKPQVTLAEAVCRYLNIPDPVAEANRRMPVGSKVKAASRACHTAFWEAQVGEPFRLLGKDLVATVRSDDGTFWIAYNCEPVENEP